MLKAWKTYRYLNLIHSVEVTAGLRILFVIDRWGTFMLRIGFSSGHILGIKRNRDQCGSRWLGLQRGGRLRDERKLWRVSNPRAQFGLSVMSLVRWLFDQRKAKCWSNFQRLRVTSVEMSTYVHFLAVLASTSRCSDSTTPSMDRGVGFGFETVKDGVIIWAEFIQNLLDQWFGGV
jgi:hypothetical protein